MVHYYCSALLTGRAWNEMAPIRLRVVGKKGAVVRAGEALDSAKVATLARGSFVYAQGYDAAASRLRVATPDGRGGWASAKVLESAPLSFCEARRAPLLLVARCLDGASLGRLRRCGREPKACAERWAKAACAAQRTKPPSDWRRSTVDWLTYVGAVDRRRLDACANHACLVAGGACRWIGERCGFRAATWAPLKCPVRVAAVACGGRDQGGAFSRSFVLLLDAAGRCWATGENGHGQLGVGDTDDRDDLVPLDLKGVLATQLAASSDWAGLVAADRSVYTWGRGRRTLGLGGPPGRDVLRPARVPDLGRVVALAAGERHAVALDVDGGVLTWGVDDGHGVLGRPLTGHKADRVFPLSRRVDGPWLVDDVSRAEGRPAALALPEGAEVVAAAAGGLHTVLVTAAGGLLGFGANNHGQLGVSRQGHLDFDAPDYVDGADGVVAAAARGHGTVFLGRDGSVRALGAFQPVRSRRPTALDAGGRATAVAATVDAVYVQLADAVVAFGGGAPPALRLGAAFPAPAATAVAGDRVGHGALLRAA